MIQSTVWHCSDMANNDDKRFSVIWFVQTASQSYNSRSDSNSSRNHQTEAASEAKSRCDAAVLRSRRLYSCCCSRRQTERTLTKRRRNYFAAVSRHDARRPRDSEPKSAFSISSSSALQSISGLRGICCIPTTSCWPGAHQSTTNAVVSLQPRSLLRYNAKRCRQTSSWSWW